MDTQEQVSISNPSLQRDLDVSIWDAQERRVAILYAKNKGFDQGVPPRDDVHQIITYMATLRCPLGALVGIQTAGPASSGEHALRGGVGRLLVARLPGRGTMAELRNGLAGWSGVLGPGWESPLASSVESR